MKSSRQSAILEIIETQNIETQDDIARELLERGFKVTQATISRDIKELHLIKVQSEVGVYKYVVNESDGVLNTEKMMRVFRETVSGVCSAGNNLIIVTTMNGSAGAAAEVVDNMNVEGILGSIAGDNTIFIAVKDGMSEMIAQKLKQASKK